MNQTLPGDSPLPKNIWGWLLWSLFLCVVVANGIKLSYLPLQVDVAYCLYMGQRLLDGKHLYSDIKEINPPLIYFLNTIPNWVATLLDLNVKFVWVAATSVAISVPTAIAIALLNRLKIVSGWLRTLTGFVLIVICVPFFGSVFGERDHLAFAALVPIIILAANRLAGENVSLPLAVFASLWAGVFLALKPFFLFPWFFCLLYVALRMRGKVLRQPETFLIPFVTLLHVGLILLFTPAYIDVARLLTKLYGGYDVPRRVILAALWAPSVGVVLAFCYRSSLLNRSLIRLGSLATLGWICSAVIQHKGNDYHLQPAIASLALLMTFIILDLWRTQVWNQISFLSVAAAGLSAFLLVACFTTWKIYTLDIEYFDDTKVLLPFLRDSRNERVVFLSTAVIGFPVVNETGVEFGSAYPCLWTLPGLYTSQVRNMPPESELKFHDMSTMPPIERDLFDRTYLDLLQHPRLIIVDTHKDKWAMGTAVFDFETYFQRDERIQKLWSHYEKLPEVKNFRIYRLNDPNLASFGLVKP